MNVADLNVVELTIGHVDARVDDRDRDAASRNVAPALLEHVEQRREPTVGPGAGRRGAEVGHVVGRGALAVLDEEIVARSLDGWIGGDGLDRGLELGHGRRREAHLVVAERRNLSDDLALDGGGDPVGRSAGLTFDQKDHHQVDGSPQPGVRRHVHHPGLVG